jgi:peptidoglycan hydrolase-like protein with peptidoglycan-binding domain
MGVVPARLVFLAFFGLTGCIIYNALYLQDGHGLGTGAAVSPKLASALPDAPGNSEAPKLPPVSTDLPPLPVEAHGSQLMVRAVQRELASRGFDVGEIDGNPSDKTRKAISSYQSKEGLAVTGEATDELLHHILLGDSVKPAVATGSLEEAATAEAKGDPTIQAVQQILADLGYAPGPVDGLVGTATTHAISAFQHDRKVAETGRVTPELLQELKRVTGRDLTKTAARP